MMTKISYSGYRFPPEIIQLAIWLYFRFTLSFRDVEDLLLEREIGLCSHCQIEHVTNRLARQVHAAATTSRHVCTAKSRKARCVLADVR